MQEEEQYKIEFDVSKDTKFTTRVILTHALFVFAIYLFKIDFTAFGFSLSSNSKTGFAMLSIIVMLIHLVLLHIYQKRDFYLNREKVLDLWLEVEDTLTEHGIEIEKKDNYKTRLKTLKDIYKNASGNYFKNQKEIETMYEEIRELTEVEINDNLLKSKDIVFNVINKYYPFAVGISAIFILLFYLIPYVMLGLCALFLWWAYKVVRK